MTCFQPFQLSGVIFNGHFLWKFLYLCVGHYGPQRNDSIFMNLQHSVASCKYTFRKELALAKLRAKDNFQTGLDQWLNSFV
jgi:hypothetical protein